MTVAGGDGRRVPSLLMAMAALTLTRVALLALGYPRARRLGEWVAGGTRRPGPAAAAGGWQREFASRVTDQIVRAAVFFPGRAICLEQSLALYTLLRQRGVPAELRLGVQPYPFTAHAWVELDGAPVNETEERIRHFHLLRSEA